VSFVLCFIIAARYELSVAPNWITLAHIYQEEMNCDFWKTDDLRNWSC